MVVPSGGEDWDLQCNITGNTMDGRVKTAETSFTPVYKDYHGLCPIHDEQPSGETPGCRQGWKNALRDFTQDTTLHGFRYIVMSDTFALRRLLWLLLLLAGAGIMCFQIIDRIITYYDWPVNVNVEINFNKSLTFPAITICNQNTFRATAAARDGRYRLIEELYTRQDSGLDLAKFGAENTTLDDLYLSAAHRKEDLIVECMWDGRPCTAANFSLVTTDHGVCYTFAGNSEALEVNSAGSDNGLHLTLNIEQYEYMPGPHGAAGVKIFMHDRTDTPLVGELGFAIPAGSHSFVGNSLLLINNLPWPHGECGEKKLEYFELYTSANCKIDCLTRFLEKSCGCRELFMPHVNDYPPVCNLKQKYECMLPALRNFTDDISFCGPCFVPCAYSVYQPILSYATISNFVIDKLLSNINSEQLGQSFMAAKEITHRMEDNKFNKYRRLVDNIKGKFQKVQNLLEFDIPEKLEYLTENMKKHKTNIEEVWNRKYFIYGYQDYIVQKNFLRGRSAMEERTFSHIGDGFQQNILHLEAKIKLLTDPAVNDSNVRFLVHDLVTEDLEVEAEMVRRGISNFTTLIDAFRNGTEIFHYRYPRIPRSRNQYVIPRDLLRTSLVRTWGARTYGGRLTKDLSRLLNAILDFRDLIDEAYETGSYNETRLSLVKAEYKHLNERYYHNKANLYFESIDWAAKTITSRKEQFYSLKLAVDSIFTNMEGNINSLAESLANVQETIIGNLGHGCDKAEEYLTNSSISKLEVSRDLTASSIHEGINTMKVFLQEVRSRGQNIFDDWTKLISAVTDIWSNILDDTDSREYYEYMNMTDFLQDKMAFLFRQELAIAGVREFGDLRDVIKNRGRIFLKALYDIMDESEDFKKTTTLDGNFLRDNFVFLNIYYSELSYEEITQQEGYGLFPLLCDIGGSMGLFIGASALTLFEIIDVFVNQIFLDCLRPRKRNSPKPTKV